MASIPGIPWRSPSVVHRAGDAGREAGDAAHLQGDALLELICLQVGGRGGRRMGRGRVGAPTPDAAPHRKQTDTATTTTSMTTATAPLPVQVSETKREIHA